MALTFNISLINGYMPFPYLQRQFLAESRNARAIFDLAISDIVKQIQYVISNTSEYNPEFIDEYDFNTSGRFFYSGWAFDSKNNKVVETEDTSHRHGIFLRYYMTPSYSFDLATELREDYDADDDSIVINVNIKRLARKNYSEGKITAFVLHEFVHILQMWVDWPMRINSQNTAYLEFQNWDYLRKFGLKENFIPTAHLNHLYNTMMLLSDLEIESRQEEIDEYIRLNGWETAVCANYMTSSTYIDDFFREYATHLYYSYRNAETMLTNLKSIINDIDDSTQSKRGFNLLCLFTSALITFGFIKDDFKEDFKDYKQCLLLQSGEFELTPDISGKLIEAVNFLAEKLNEYTGILYKEVDSACRKYKIDEILIHERNRRPEYKCVYDEDVEYDYEGDYPVLYELENKESNVMNESYTNWRTQQKKIDSADQEEYLKESLSILFESLFDTDKWQFYGNS